MAKGDLLVGLDIGTTKICMLVAEVADGEGSPADRLEIIGVGSVPSTGVRKGVVVDIEQTAQAIRESVEQACRQAGAEVHSVIVGVTGEHIASLNSRGVIAITHSHREVTAEDVERVGENSRVIVLPPDREIIHALPRGYALDGQSGIRSPVGMSGTRLEVETHIVTGATTFLRNVVTSVERAGLRIEELVLEPLATGEAVLLPAERELGVALIDIGGGTADLAIFRGGDICYSAVIPAGGDYVTRDISAGLRVSHAEAERVKLAGGRARVLDLHADADATFDFTRLGDDAPTTLPTRDLAEIIEPRAQEILQLVRQEVNRSGYANHLPAGIVLSGGGALLAGLRELSVEVTHLPTRIGAPRVSRGAAVGGFADQVATPGHATAVGLLRWGAQYHAAYAASSRRTPSGSLMGAVIRYFRRFLRDFSG